MQYTNSQSGNRPIALLPLLLLGFVGLLGAGAAFAQLPVGQNTSGLQPQANKPAQGTPTVTPVMNSTATDTPTATPGSATNTPTRTSTIAPTSTRTNTSTPLPTQTPGGPSATSVRSETPARTNTATPTRIGTPPTLTPTACRAAGWSIYEQGRPDSSDLEGISATGPNDVWAAGATSDDGGLTQRQLVMHWDGVNWSEVFTQTQAGSSDGFGDISARASNDVWAVGSRYDNWTVQTLTAHWDGASWSVVPSPNITGTNFLQGVAAIQQNDVWAVGEGNSSALILHWDGTSWSQLPFTPTVGDLKDVDADSSSDVWIVSQDRIVHWDGRSQ